MANQVYEVEEITLQDDTDVTVKPLPIGRLRRFMSAWGKFAEVKDEDDGFNVFVNCAGISLEHEFKDKFTSTEATLEQKKKGEFLSKEYKEYLENVLDLDTIYKVLDVAGGLKLNDPKLLEQMEVAAAQAASA